MSGPDMDPLKLEKNTSLLFIGDSITDAARDPSGEAAPWSTLGKGYVSLIESWLSATYPDRRIRIMNKGVSGNTVVDLKARWQRDVLDIKPDWLSIMIGINDVWRHFDVPLCRERHVTVERYAETLEELIKAARPQLKGLILAAPYFIELNAADPMRQKMDEFGAVVRNLAGRFDAVFVDTQAAFDRVLQHVHPMALAWDRVHPQPAGHMILAKAFLASLCAL